MQDFTTVEMNAVWGLLGVAALSIIYVFLIRRRMLAQDQGTTRMQEVWKLIQSGAGMYLQRQWRATALLAGALALLAGASVLLVTPTPEAVDRFGRDQVRLWVGGGRALALLAGSLSAFGACAVGMQMAVEGQVRMVAAARKGYSPALNMVYGASSATGMLVIGLGLLGSLALFLVFGITVADMLISFAAGSVLTALLLRSGSGIYAQATAMAADLVSKVDLDIESNDPRNTAFVASIVGDNADDSMGATADFFESFELVFVAALILGLSSGFMADEFTARFILFPFMLRGVGIVATLIGSLVVRTNESRRNAMAALNRGFYLTVLLVVAGFAGASWYLMADPTTGRVDWRPFMAATVGVVLAVLLHRITEYFTATSANQVKELGQFARTGPTTLVLAGLALGMESGLWTLITVALSILASVWLYAGLEGTFTSIFYSIALTGIGLLTLSGSLIAMSGFRPIAHSARWIGSVSGLDKNARNVMDDMDAVGQRARAMVRGTGSGATVLTAVALLGVFFVNTERVLAFFGYPLPGINSVAPLVLIGLLIGSALPLVCAALVLRAILRVAAQVVALARQQFRQTTPDSDTLVADTQTVPQSTTAAQHELLSLVLIIVLMPILIGLFAGLEALGGFLIGVFVSSFVLAIGQTNAGSAWSSIRWYIEDGHYGGKHSEAHKAALVGDVLGGPLKAGVTALLNAAIKVTGLIALVVAPVVALVRPPDAPLPTALWIVLVAGVLVLVWVIAHSHRATHQMAELTKGAAAQGRL